MKCIWGNQCPYKGKSFSLSGIRCSLRGLPVGVPGISGTSPIGISGAPRAFPSSTWSWLFWCWCPDWALGMVLLDVGHISLVLCSTRGLVISLPCLPITVYFLFFIYLFIFYLNIFRAFAPRTQGSSRGLTNHFVGLFLKVCVQLVLSVLSKQDLVTWSQTALLGISLPICIVLSFLFSWEIPVSCLAVCTYHDLWQPLCTSGILVGISRSYRSLAGLAPVGEWGVLLYAMRNFRSSCLQFFLSACAISKAFKRLRFCLSISAFAWGHSGVEVLCSVSFSSKYDENSSEMNCRPLSVLGDSAVKWVENIVSKHSIIFLNFTDFTTATSKYRL